jgi:hypothetical protein
VRASHTLCIQSTTIQTTFVPISTQVQSLLRQHEVCFPRSRSISGNLCQRRIHPLRPRETRSRCRSRTRRRSENRRCQPGDQPSRITKRPSIRPRCHDLCETRQILADHDQQPDRHHERCVLWYGNHFQLEVHRLHRQQRVGRCRPWLDR